MRLLRANLNKRGMNIGESMDATTPLWAFNVFVILMLGWLYHYFWTMFNAIADMNDKLISIINGEETQEDEMQMKLDKWLDSEEE